MSSVASPVLARAHFRVVLGVVGALFLDASRLAAAAAPPLPLAFDVVEQVIEVGYYPREFYVDFLFTTSGTVPVRIRNFSSSCPCTAVAMEKVFYLPGQKGIVTAIYNFAAKQEELPAQVVEVLTDQSPQAILLKIVPRCSAKGIWTERRELRWIGGQERVPLSFIVEIAPALRDRALVLTLTGEGAAADWRAQTEALDLQGCHRVTVTPAKDLPAAASLRLGLGGGAAEADAASATATVRLFPKTSGL